MTDFLKIAKSIVVHFAHICAYGVETDKHHIFNFLTKKKSTKIYLADETGYSYNYVRRRSGISC